MPKVLLLGPALSNQGGIATVEGFYLKNWDYKHFKGKHIATMANGSTLFKLQVFLRALGEYILALLFWSPRIIHIHFATGASFYRKMFFVLLARLFGKKLILHCHAYDFDRFYERHTGLRRQIVRWFLESADCLLVVAEQWQAYFETLKLRVPVRTLYNPAPHFSPVSTNSDNGKIVLSLGRLGERKGTYDVLEAIPKVLACHPTAEFWLGGDGDVDRVAQIIAKESWGQQVRLLGWVRDEEKERVLAQASIFLLPSYQEGLPMAILEAMAYGLPVISTPVGGIPEMVADGENGFLVKPGDVATLAQKITLLLDNVALRDEMGSRSSEVVAEKFEIHGILEQLYTIYEEIII